MVTLIPASPIYIGIPSNYPIKLWVYPLAALYLFALGFILFVSPSMFTKAYEIIVRKLLESN